MLAQRGENMVYCADLCLTFPIVTILRTRKTLFSIALSAFILLLFSPYGLMLLQARAQNPQGNADPTLLPVAERQMSAGNPQAITSAGSYYVDSITGVKVWRATGPDYPCVGNGGMSGDDVSDITQISRDLGGGKHTILIHTCGTYRLADFTRGEGFSNWRDMHPDALPDRALAFSFSNTRKTPHIAYSIHDSELVRYNTMTNSVENTGSFPVELGDGDWLQNDASDKMFLMTSGNTCLAWDSVQNDNVLSFEWGILRKCSLENHGRYVDVNIGEDGDLVWDLQTDIALPIAPPTGTMMYNASPSGYFTAVDTDSGGGRTPHFRMNPITREAVRISDFCGSVSGFHQSGNWIQTGESDERQWFMISTHGGGQGCLVDALGFMRLDGSEVRLLTHTFSQGEGAQAPFGTISPDGKVAMFHSTGTRAEGDVFVAEVPLDGPVSTPTPGCPRLSGDVTCDGRVDIADLAYLADVLISQATLASGAQLQNAEMNADDRIGIADLVVLADKLVGLY